MQRGRIMDLSVRVRTGGGLLRSYQRKRVTDMKLRSFRPSDVQIIDQIWREHHSDDFSVPARDNALIDAVVENKAGEVIAYGQVKLFAEAMLILDLNASQREKVFAIKSLMLEAFRGADIAGIKQMYAFIQDPDFALLIKRHFGFDTVNKGEVLLREEV